MFATIGYYICLPFAALTRLFYSLTGSYGVALILFTLVVKLVMLPFQLKSKKSMLRMNRMQDKVKEIQTRYANNREKQQMEMTELYAREGINPMSGCLWSLIPFPILIALYNIIRYPLHYFMSIPKETIAKISELAATLGYTAAADAQSAVYEEIYLTKFIHDHFADFQGKFDGLIDLNYNFLGLDLSIRPSSVMGSFPGGWPVIGILLLPIIAAAIQLVFSMVTMKQTPGGGGSTKMMMYMMPLMTVWMGFMLPAALGVYWIAQSAFSLLQELTLNKYFNKILDREETDKEREKREKRMAKYEKQKALMQQYNAAQQEDTKSKKKKQPQAKHKNGGEKQQHVSTNENGRVGNRPYARGRAYDEQHYGK